MRITLVIPCYNEQMSIGPCLEAVKAQTRQFDEILVIDNNCTDSTVAVVERYSGELPIRVLIEERQGVAWASQRGYDEASGQVIARIDADTRMEPTWARVVEEFLSAHPEVGGVGGGFWFYDLPRFSFRKSAFAKAAKYGSNSPGRRLGLMGHNMAIRKSAWEAARSCVSNFPGTHEDLDVSLALGEVGVELRTLPGMVVGLSPRRYTTSLKPMIDDMVAVLRTLGVHGRRWEQMSYALTIPVNALVMLAIGAVARRSTVRIEKRVSPITK